MAYTYEALAEDLLSVTQEIRYLHFRADGLDYYYLTGYLNSVAGRLERIAREIVESPEHPSTARGDEPDWNSSQLPF